MKKIEIIQYSRLQERARSSARIVELAVFIFVVIIFGLKVVGYVHVNIFNPVGWVRGIEHVYSRVSYNIGELKYFGECPDGQQKIDIGQQYLCRAVVKSSTYQRIYDTSPRNVNGKEAIYPFLDEWSQQKADGLLHNTYAVDRYKPVTLKGTPTWQEDPYNDRYWRFNYYSLRDLKDLLGAAYATHDPRYSKKLVAITDSFLTNGMDQPHAWDDYHAVAWRSMILTDMWYKLHALNQLPIGFGNKLLAALERHGAFMQSTSHYEPQFNHGINEATALYELGVDFPGLNGATTWAQTGRQRLAETLDDLVNNDGGLNEHSPYYGFYVLSKYWDAYMFSNKYDQQIAASFRAKITAMVDYATYILQPNSHIPLLGSSLDEVIHNTAEYAAMGKEHPAFKYVLTQGKQGKAPKEHDVVFRQTGQTILRSSWDSKNYTRATQLIFNYGPYVTSHSHLDSLSIELYGAGQELLPGPGLYTYDENALHDYFHGTASHNTVSVDNQDQQQGTGSVGAFTQTESYVSSSASNKLYKGVTQERQVMTFGADTVLILDKEVSNSKHLYTQNFHLFPGAQLTHSGLTYSARTSSGKLVLKISQLQTRGITVNTVYNQTTVPIGGLCSRQYGVLIPCHQIGYSQTGRSVQYVTLLQVSPTQHQTETFIQDGKIHLTVDGKSFVVAIHEATGHAASVKVDSPKPPQLNEAILDTMSDRSKWNVTNGSTQSAAGSGDDPQNNATAFSTVNGDTATMQRSLALDLSNKNLVFSMNLPSAATVDDLNLTLHSPAGTATQQLKNVYDNIHDNDLNSTGKTSSEQVSGWSRISLAKSSSRSSEGQWILQGSFDWSKVTSVEFSIRANPGATATVQLQNIGTYAEQAKGSVLIVFDDGSASIQPAVSVLNKYALKANIGVIGKYPATALSGYLSVNALKKLQSKGWSIINHSYYHQDAVSVYYDQNRLGDFEADVLKGAEFLQNHGINSDPNWYIYPYGTTNAGLQAVLKKYYKFARSELTAPEAFPFGNPLAVKDFIVENNTTPQQVIDAAADAMRYHETLLLTFHRIHGNSSDKSGYDIQDFTKIVKAFHDTHTNVVTFNQLDASNGVPVSKVKFVADAPNQLNSKITVVVPTFLQRLKGLL